MRPPILPGAAVPFTPRDRPPVHLYPRRARPSRPQTRLLSFHQWRLRMRPLLLTLTLRPFLYHPVDLSTSEDFPELLFVQPLIWWEPSIRDPRLSFGGAPVGRVEIRSITVGDKSRVGLVTLWWIITDLLVVWRMIRELFIWCFRCFFKTSIGINEERIKFMASFWNLVCPNLVFFRK